MESKFRKWEEIKVGDQDFFEEKISQDLILAFAEVSGDKNSLHSKNGIAHGMLLASLLSRFVGMYLPGRNSLYLSQTLNFKSSVWAGDFVLVEGKVVAKSESTKVLTIETTIKKSTCEVVLEGEAKVLYRKF